MLFKMLGIEHAWKRLSDTRDKHKPRQIFVTQSRVLATKVEEYFSQLMLSLEAVSSSPKRLRKMGKGIEREMEFVDLDDIDQWRPDLPRKFSELTNDDFPLFIPYDRVRVAICFPDFYISLMTLSIAFSHASARHRGGER
jgi:hypothetical protein